MGSSNMAVLQVVCACLVGVVAGQEARTLPETVTPVPILRYIDQQNGDGSYTYGFEAGDGTYKIETRLADGQVKGKYGYYDPEGQLREAIYGATSKGGFQPQIQGVLLPPVYTEEDYDTTNDVEPVVINQGNNVPRKFSNFMDRRTQEIIPSEDVNRQRGFLKRRLVKKPERFEEKIYPEERLRTRQHQLKQLREHRRQLEQVQQRHIQRNQVQERHIQRNQVQERHIQRNQVQERHIQRNQVQERHIQRNQVQERHIQRNQVQERHIQTNQVRSYSQDQDQEAFRSFRAQPQTPQYLGSGPVDPYVTHGTQFGSYSIRY